MIEYVYPSFCSLDPVTTGSLKGDTAFDVGFTNNYDVLAIYQTPHGRPPPHSQLPVLVLHQRFLRAGVIKDLAKGKDSDDVIVHSILVEQATTALLRRSQGIKECSEWLKTYARHVTLQRPCTFSGADKLFIHIDIASKPPARPAHTYTKGHPSLYICLSAPPTGARFFSPGFPESAFQVYPGDAVLCQSLADEVFHIGPKKAVFLCLYGDHASHKPPPLHLRKRSSFFPYPQPALVWNEGADTALDAAHTVPVAGKAEPSPGSTSIVALAHYSEFAEFDPIDHVHAPPVSAKAKAPRRSNTKSSVSATTDAASSSYRPTDPPSQPDTSVPDWAMHEQAGRLGWQDLRAQSTRKSTTRTAIPPPTIAAGFFLADSRQALFKALEKKKEGGGGSGSGQGRVTHLGEIVSGPSRAVKGWDAPSMSAVEMKRGSKDMETKGKEKKGKETTGKQRKGKDTTGPKEKKARKVLGPKLPNNGQHAVGSEAASPSGKAARVTGEGSV